MSANKEVETLSVNDDSDCEIVDSAPFMDVPDYIDPKSLNALINEPSEDLPPVVAKIVKKLTNDEEFEKECDKFYKANLAIDCDLVRVDVAKVISEKDPPPPPAKKLKTGNDVDIRTMKELSDICLLCGESNNHVNLLDEHFKNKHHLKNGLLVCPFCDFTSSNHDVVMKHTTKVHKVSNKNLKCEVCDFSTFRGDLFNRHLNRHTVYKCNDCTFRTVYEPNVKKHYMLAHTPDALHKCGFCPSKFTNQVSLKRHLDSKHRTDKKDECQVWVSKKSTPIGTTKKQQETDVSGRKDFTYICVHCNYKTKSTKLLNEHTLFKHPEEEILFCNLCDFSTTVSAELTQHAKTHLKSEPTD